MHLRGVLSDDNGFQGCVSQGKKSVLRRSSSDPQDRGMRVKFNPLVLLLDASLEGEYELVQRVIYDVSWSLCGRSLVSPHKKVFNNDGPWLILGDSLWVGPERVRFWSQSNKLVQTRTLNPHMDHHSRVAPL